MNRVTDRVVLLTLAAGGILLLSGCTAGEAAPSATPTVTETVTSSPEPAPEPSPVERSASDPTGPLDAWLACVGWAHGNYVNEYPDATVAEYSEDAVVGDDGGYMVTVNIDPGGGAVGVYATCGVSGTVGNPVIESTGMGDFG